tara:strand:- start:124 stop:921 length:798 start_codon:yes stop_codon:yes gene_type:complete
MPSLTLKNLEKSKKNKNSYPVAIVKGERESEYYNKVLYLNTDQNSEGETEIIIPEDVCFQLLPNTDKDKRDVYYITGASGSGKSYIAKTIANNYHKLYPDRKIWVVSKLDEDDTLDGIKAPVMRVKVDMIKDGIDINALSNSLIIFDDFDTISGKNGIAVQLLIDDIAIMGRKHTNNQGNITMLILSHYLTNYKKTRIILNESNWFVVYPQATSTHALTYLLKTHLGLEKDEVKKLKKMGRWVAFHKSYPQFLLSAHSSAVLHTE